MTCNFYGYNLTPTLLIPPLVNIETYPKHQTYGDWGSDPISSKYHVTGDFVCPKCGIL